MHVRRTLAAIGSAVFFLLAPGATAVLIPWLLTGWDSNQARAPARAAGALLLAAGRDSSLPQPSRVSQHDGECGGGEHVGRAKA